MSVSVCLLVPMLLLLMVVVVIDSQWTPPLLHWSNRVRLENRIEGERIEDTDWQTADRMWMWMWIWCVFYFLVSVCLLSSRFHSLLSCLILSSVFWASPGFSRAEHTVCLTCTSYPFPFPSPSPVSIYLSPKLFACLFVCLPLYFASYLCLSLLLTSFLLLLLLLLLLLPTLQLLRPAWPKKTDWLTNNWLASTELNWLQAHTAIAV